MPSLILWAVEQPGVSYPEGTKDKPLISLLHICTSLFRKSLWHKTHQFTISFPSSLFFFLSPPQILYPSHFTDPFPSTYPAISLLPVLTSAVPSERKVHLSVFCLPNSYSSFKIQLGSIQIYFLYTASCPNIIYWIISLLILFLKCHFTRTKLHVHLFTVP